MSLHLQFLENLDTFSFEVYEEKENIKSKISISKFENRFEYFWNKFKDDVLEGGTSFYMPIDNEHHLPHLLAIKDIVEKISNTQTVENHEKIVDILNEMKENGIGFEIVSKNGGLSFIRLVPISLLYDEYNIIDIE